MNRESTPIEATYLFPLDDASHVVLTDGEVTNTDEVLALARSNTADARIFTFGIGAGASHHLVNGLARAGGGTAEFSFPGEHVEPKVVRQFGRLLSPALTNVLIDWGAADVTPESVRPSSATARASVTDARRLDRVHAAPPAGDDWLDGAAALLQEATA